jgi:hypothetical protein
LYALATLAASVHMARRHGWVLLPVVFAVYHGAYGPGFLAGLLRWRRSAPARKENVFTQLSR